ncbi:MAG TPA: DNA translocase FtsK 4TM domain-containing protein [Pyrinomonadaceae bacterium]|nr:DNA translocase FtsK 4TM domain-containing protein [Pyrinomonadaceae bacterium]
MATTAARKKQITAKTNSRSNEIIAVILLALAVLVFLCLVSYNPMDPTFNTVSSQKVQNWVGVVGANFAEFLVSIVGLTAYFLPALIVLMAWRVFRAKDLQLSLTQILGYFLFIVSVSSLAALFGFQGGISGVFFQQIFFSLLGKIGTTILLSAFFLTSLLLITSLSLSMFFGSFGMAFENFGIHFNEWLTKRRERSAERNAQIIEQTDKMPEPQAVKAEKAKPTISLGDIVPAVAETKNVKIRDTVSALFEDLKKSPEKKEEKLEEKLPVVEEEIAWDEIARNDEPVEKIIPTISVSEKAFEEPEKESFETENNFVDLIAESEKIPITPIQQTGELDGEFLEVSAEEPEIVQPKKPQNFENYILPPPEFLTPATARIEQKDEELLAIAQELTDKTKEFNVTGRVMHICQGPVVTTYEFKPDPGVKYSRVTGLADDLCLALKAESIRIDRIPGKAFVGIEVPNREREVIQLREVIESKKFKDSNSMLSIALGKSIDGLNYVADLAKMPHLLIAGATGAGKSVGVNTLIVSILYKAKPDEVKLIMVDPKQVELGIYADIPHLATPIITDPKRAAISLKWAVGQMERRYKDLAGWGVRNIDGYNEQVKKRNDNGQFDENGEPWKKLPFIVIIIDELADLMMVAGKEVEESITRLAQMARAVGIHLVLATQRPSVDVITGLIKANFPSRISFRVSSKVDSRTIIDANGAESLLGKGDMLFLPPGTSNLIRVHGAFVDEKEIFKIVEHIKAQGNPEYDTTITKTDDELDDSGDLPGKKDPLFWDAVKSVVSAKRASTSLLQRHLRIGYGRAAAILDAMVREGYIGEMDGSTRARPILQKAYEDLQDIEEMNN